MKICMISTQYPPMLGGVGRYTFNLVRALIKKGIEVNITCHEEGNGDFNVLKFDQKDISDVLLSAVKKCKPDLIHLQHEFQLYDSDTRYGTRLSKFYAHCGVPIVTTFHSVWKSEEFIRSHSLIKPQGRIGRIGIPLRGVLRAINIRRTLKWQQEILRQLSSKSAEVINLSQTSQQILQIGPVVYHGAEPPIDLNNKYEIRKLLGLPQDGMLALAFGFGYAAKGWEILEKLRLPRDWQIVINYSKDPFSGETRNLAFNNIINLDRGYLNEEQLSQLFFACDVLLLPYKLVSCSGVMFDGFAHGLPFIASDLAFFNEFASLGLGITADRHPNSFSDALISMDENYDAYKAKVQEFSRKLNWSNIAEDHLQVYTKVLER